MVFHCRTSRSSLHNRRMTPCHPVVHLSMIPLPSKSAAAGHLVLLGPVWASSCSLSWFWDRQVFVASHKGVALVELPPPSAAPVEHPPRTVHGSHGQKMQSACRRWRYCPHNLTHRCMHNSKGSVFCTEFHRSRHPFHRHLSFRCSTSLGRHTKWRLRFAHQPGG